MSGFLHDFSALMTAWDINLLRDIPILFGSVFVLTAAVGVLRFPDLYTRLHASSKLVTLGSAGIYLGVAADFSDVAAFTRVLAVLLFQFLTTPLSAYLIAQASYLRGLPAVLHTPDEGKADAWDIFGAAQDISQIRRLQAVQEEEELPSPHSG
ncbi:cation:proton antiporter [Deinococcus piscis]|uniref:Cation:proton antiporter n=1 Tax=Deinococcus piscis TaxID=394230 RepID=A0ABQ3K9Y2_9DEIO|nr:monovalent cation/H(+) antiporter subunit G [Deinococcus piscis]GHG09601.1 cation:proton antiporter [Deinococcus piscis]